MEVKKCVFIENNGFMKCSDCGFEMKYIPNVIRICKKVEYPSTTQQLINVSKSIVNIATNGLDIISEKLYDERISICNGKATGTVCEFFNNNRCKSCGCFFITKLKIAGERCPEGKWGPKQ